MARKTSTTSTTSTDTSTRTATSKRGAKEAVKEATRERRKDTRRITSLVAKPGKVLSSLEEAVVRMHHGVSVKPQAQLPTNGVTDALMGEFFEMEIRAHTESGRIDDLPEIPEAARRSASTPANARTRKLVEELKKKG